MKEQQAEPNQRNILMVAAENGALPGGKVGGIGDVVRDVPEALAAAGCRVSVIVPAYYSLARLEGASRMAAVTVTFGGLAHELDIYEIVTESQHARVRHWLVDHPAMSPGGAGRIYCDDGPDSPFATDATKFAFFCAAVAELIQGDFFGSLDVLHLHDWHAAMLLLLRRHHPHYGSLQGISCIYSIHNLALQGIRPLEGHASSLQSWFPGISVEASATDPRWPECINLMRTGINFADRVHTVSPTYAREILEPSAVQERGYFGGEGLEADLQQADQQGRLIGILNGCDYPGEAREGQLDRTRLPGLLKSQLLRWIGSEQTLPAVHYIADQRLQQFAARGEQVLVTSVGRITDQKAKLLVQDLPDGRTALEALLDRLGERGTWLFLGSGDEQLEQFFVSVSARYTNFIFLRGYSDDIAQALYSCGDLFMMPSSFEPCGISQMLAMRAGQPCLVHQVGGLNDTVEDGVSGFTFCGESLKMQAQAMVQAFAEALRCIEDEPEKWQKIRTAATGSRFTWHSSVEQYLRELYR